ncbi:MAG: hypothetical protein V8R52_07595 [Coprobacter fastidiosus]
MMNSKKSARLSSSLDELIETTSRKVEILKEHKKGLMQQLFPKNRIYKNMDLLQIAKQIRNASENIFLIYAFNSTGKTRLSVEYKEAARNTEGRQTGVYYNAFSEDLFIWDNSTHKIGYSFQQFEPIS